MDIEPLKKLWQQSLHGNAGTNEPGDWNQQVNCIYQCGKGLEETLRYLHNQRPTLEAFIQWMLPAGQAEIDKDDIVTGDVLTAADIRFFETNGYIVLRQAITTQQAEDAKNAVLQHLQISLDDAATWYNKHEEQRGLMLTFYHHPALDVVRNSARVKKAYKQLYGTGHIYKVIDKVSFNPPVTPGYTFTGSPLHWDVSLVTPIPFKLQGLLYLNDVTANGGAFHCVPGFHKQIEDWLTCLPPGVNGREEAVRTLKPVPITGKAGDFIIWHQALPHCATANHSNTPRIVQYHTWLPDNVKDQALWK